MTIRVLHLFFPSFGSYFSGHNIRWQRQFIKWDDRRVQHLILQTESRSFLPATHWVKTPNMPFHLTKGYLANAIWSMNVLASLIHNRPSFDILHVHVQLTGALLAAPLIKILGKTSLREISLLDSDTPSLLTESNGSYFKIWCFNRYDQLLCISEALRQNCINFGFDSNKVHTLLNPVDIERFKPVESINEKMDIRRELCLQPENKIMLFVGSVKFRKGFDLSLTALCSILRLYPDLLFVVIGPNSSEMSPGVDDSFVYAIHERIDKENLINNIRFVGKITDDEILARYYQAADFLVFPSRREGLGNVMLEAMASGLPVIASHLHGITDKVIKDGENGFLIPIGDHEAIAGIMEFLIGHQEAGFEIGQNASKYVVRNHSFKSWQEKLFRIYQSQIK